MPTIIKAFPRRPDDGSVTPALAGWLDLVQRLIKSDVYTPTLTNVTNVGASSVTQANYFRIGNMVHVSVLLSIDPTAAAGAATELGISLPIPSNFANSYECAGVGNAGTGDQGGRVEADTTNNRASLQFAATSTSNITWGIEFTYQII